MKKFIYLSLVSALVFVGCGKKEEAKTEVVVKPKYVVTEEVQERELSQTFKSDAVLAPEAKVDHFTEKGGTIEEIYKKNGEMVKKGDLVMKLRDADTEAAYTSAKTVYTSAKTKFDSFKKLYDQNLISYLEYTGYESEFSSAKANFDIAKSNYDKLFRKADISGIVGNLFGKIGNDVSDEDVLFTVVDNDNMEAYIGFPPQFLDKIQVGGTLDVEIPAVGENVQGKILEINPIAEIDTKNFKVKIGIDNSNKKIQDGMYAYVTVPVGAVTSMSVPEESIFIRDLLSYIYIVEDGKAVRVEVTPGASDSLHTIISSNEVDLGDKVVVDGVFGLENGAPVEESKK